MWCFETCPTTHKEHMHYYLILRTKVRINKVSELFDYMHPNIQKCDNNHAALKKYIMKQGQWQQWGDEPLTRQAKAAATVKLTAEETLAKYSSYEELLKGDFDFASKHAKAAKEFYALKVKDMPHAKPLVVWISGDTGTGKSALAYYLCGEERFRKVGKLDWFDGYHGQANVTFDDFRKCNVEWSFLLNLLDWYKLDDLPVKGSFVSWRPKLVVFTCPHSAEDEFVYRDEAGNQPRRNVENVAQILRRIDITIQAVDQWTYVVTKGGDHPLVADLDGETVRNWVCNEQHE